MLVVARSAHPRERCAHAGQPPCWSVSSGLRGTRLKGLRSTARRPPPPHPHKAPRYRSYRVREQRSETAITVLVFRAENATRLPLFSDLPLPSHFEGTCISVTLLKHWNCC